MVRVLASRRAAVLGWRIAGVALLAVLLAAGTPPAASAQEARIERLAGAERVATAVEVSRAGWAGAGTAVVAAAHDFPDALVATALAAAHDAPLLLVGSRLAEPVAEELRRLAVAEVVVVGGPAAVPRSVEEDIRALGVAVRRAAGADRWATAAEVAREVGSPEGGVVLALGTDYPDAVAAGGLAAAPGMPLLLTERDRLPPATRSALRDLGVREASLVGGPAAISQAVVAELEAMGVTTRRLAGRDRFGTSVAVAAHALERLPGHDVPLVLATGTGFADALAAGALAARRGGTLLLVPTTDPHAEVDALLTDHERRWGAAAVVGGEAAVSAGQAAHLAELLSTDWYRLVLRGPDGGEAPLDVEVAADRESRQRGLQHREEVPDGTGMLFLFPSDTHGGFWMKDTLVPLSIAFLHADGTVQEILDMEPCRADPCPVHRPEDPYRMALEVRQGGFEDRGVVPGWVADLPEDLPEPR